MTSHPLGHSFETIMEKGQNQIPDEVLFKNVYKNLLFSNRRSFQAFISIGPFTRSKFAIKVIVMTVLFCVFLFICFLKLLLFVAVKRIFLSHFWDRPVPIFSDVRFSYLALVQDKKKSRAFYRQMHAVQFMSTFWWNCQIIFRCASFHGRAGFILNIL
jgi:hypothetical protein